MRVGVVGARSVLSLVVVALAVTASIVAAGSVPHTHHADSPGFYNQEHDLTALAAVGGGAPLPAAAAIAGAPVASRPLAVAAAPRLPSRPASNNASRAPPVSA
jgi:hypothetical protein